MRILVVDDEQSNRTFIEKVLSEHYQVTALAGGEQALAVLERGEVFDLALIDQRMPGMHGSDLLARMKESYPHMVRLAITAYAQPGQLIDPINCREVDR